MFILSLELLPELITYTVILQMLLYAIYKQMCAKTFWSIWDLIKNKRLYTCKVEPIYQFAIIKSKNTSPMTYLQNQDSRKLYHNPSSFIKLGESSSPTTHPVLGRVSRGEQQIQNEVWWVASGGKAATPLTCAVHRAEVPTFLGICMGWNVLVCSVFCAWGTHKTSNKVHIVQDTKVSRRMKNI